MMTRRGCISAIALGAGAAALGWYLGGWTAPRMAHGKPIYPERVPHLEDVKEVAGYVQRNIPHADAVGYRDYGSGCLVYFLPSSFSDYSDDEIILGLNSATGLSYVGLEGLKRMGEDEVTEKHIEEWLKSLSRLHEAGYFNLIEGRVQIPLVDDLVTVKTKDDLLHAYPVLKIVGAKGISLHGLEDYDALDNLYSLGELQGLFGQYFYCKNARLEIDTTLAHAEKALEKERSKATLFHDNKKAIGAAYSELEKANEYYTPRLEELEKRKFELMGRMNKVMASGFYDLCPYDEGMKDVGKVADHPFYKRILACGEKLNGRRGSEAVERLLERMRIRGLRQAALVFGRDEKEEVIGALDEKKISHIVLHDYPLPGKWEP